MWTRRPIVKFAMGCRTEPAAVHIAHVLQELHFFQFFNLFYNLHDLPQKNKLHAIAAKKNNFFPIIHTHLPQKKITRFDDFLYTSCIFHVSKIAYLLELGFLPHVQLGMVRTSQLSFLAWPTNFFSLTRRRVEPVAPPSDISAVPLWHLVIFRNIDKHIDGRPACQISTDCGIGGVA